jgi:hypothetical protein
MCLTRIIQRTFLSREDVQNILKTYGITAEITNFELYKRSS